MLTELVSEMDSSIIPRAKDAAAYALATREVAKETGIPVVDVWAVFAEKAGWKEGDEKFPGEEESGKNAELADLLSDGKHQFEIQCDTRTELLGLHLSASGYRLVYKELMRAILKAWPDQDPRKMPFKNKTAWEIEMGENFWDVQRD